jgi:hypothetical protein
VTIASPTGLCELRLQVRRADRSSVLLAINIVYHRLPTVYHCLPTVYHCLPTVYHRLPTVYYYLLPSNTFTSTYRERITVKFGKTITTRTIQQASDLHQHLQFPSDRCSLRTPQFKFNFLRQSPEWRTTSVCASACWITSTVSRTMAQLIYPAFSPI